MRSSPILSLFDTQPPTRRGPSALMVSLLIHGVVCAGVYFAVHHSYRLVPAKPPQRYLVRMLELSPIRAQTQLSAPRSTPEHTHAAKGRGERARPSQDASLQNAPLHEAEENPAPEALAASRLPKDALAQQRALQTMIVPDTSKQMIMKRPLPQVVLWSAPDQKVNVIIPPPPQLSVAALIASVSPPNQEMHVADLKLSATRFPAMKPLPPPSNTAPVSSFTPQQVQQMSMALAARAGRPTPTDVIIASTTQIQSGVTAVPLFNATALAAGVGAIHPGSKKGQAPEGTGAAIVVRNGAGGGSGNGPSAANALAHNTAHVGNGSGDGFRTGSGAEGTAADLHQGGGSTVAAAGPGSGGPGFVVHGADVASAEPTGGDLYAVPLPRVVTHVVLPEDGQFGMVVIGNSAAEDYPETVNIWRSRLAYSVYLKVGAPQKWILQYALPSSGDAKSSAGSGRLEAPWPYDISRPSIDADAQTDAIIIHGLLSATGHLQRLAVVFPEHLSEAAFLLHALNLWEFRPALCDGHPSAVEVLLIIPPVTE